MDEYWDSEDQWLDERTYEPAFPADILDSARRRLDSIETEENDCYA